MTIRFRLGETIAGKYQVLGKLGQGGMGCVVRVRRVTDNKPFAIKYCTSIDKSDIRRFKREVRAMKGIDHPNVMRVVGTHIKDDPPWFVMRLAQNSLADEITALSSDEDRALEAFLEICQGVEAIHNAGCIHRDIKPHNALRMRSGGVRVADLGIVKIDPRDTTILTRTNVSLGADTYKAPEQSMPGGSRNADRRTDVYQLGKTLYELVTGKSPGIISTSALPPGLAYIVAKATKSDPIERYQTVGQLVDAIGYYRRSKDPLHNPREAFESQVSQAEDQLEWARTFNPDTIKEMLRILRDSPEVTGPMAMKLFDRIPQRLLPIMAEQFGEDFLPALRKYADAIDSYVNGEGYSYADTVAAKMTPIFRAKCDPAIRTLALRALLVASVERNRFSAMGVFSNLLREVQQVELSLPIAEMLQQYRTHYAAVAKQVPPESLSPAIRSVRAKVVII